MAIGNNTNWRRENKIRLRDDIRAEFGGPAKVQISNYRLGGRYIPRSGTYTWAPMAAQSVINGRIPTFGQIPFSSYRGSTRFRSIKATVNGGSWQDPYAPYSGFPEGGISSHRGSWAEYYSFPVGYAGARNVSTWGSFHLLEVARALDWPNYIRSNMAQSSSYEVATRGAYQGFKRGFNSVQTRRPGISAWITAGTARPYVGFNNVNIQYGQRNYFRGTGRWFMIWKIFAGAFSHRGQVVRGRISPNGGNSSYQSGGGGGGGKGGKGPGNPPGGWVSGGRTPASQILYHNIQGLYAQGYRYLQVMHSMQVNNLRGAISTNVLYIGPMRIEITT